MIMGQACIGDLVYVIFHRLHAINSLRVVFPVVFSPLSSCTLKDGGY